MTTTQTSDFTPTMPARALFCAPGISLTFTPTEVELVELGLSADVQTIELFGIEFSRA